jgi:hypothetical protein
MKEKSMSKVGIILLTLSVLFVLTACQPTSAQIEKAIQQTQTAMASSSDSNAVATNDSATSETELKPTLEATLEPTPNAEVDKIIDGDPQDFLITDNDLPTDSKYYLPDSSWIGRTSNKEIVSSSKDADAAREYIAKTGRLDGWWAEFMRGSTVQKAPPYVGCQLLKFETAKGALLSLTDYNNPIAQPKNFTRTYTLSKTKFSDLGENYSAYYSDFYGNDGAKWLEYNISVAYYNWWFECYGYGPKNEIDPEFIDSIAKIQLDKLKAAPLVDSGGTL